MKTCSDCLYYEECQNRYSWLDQEDNTKYITCEKFKNKADFVEVVRCNDCIHFETITLDSGISVGLGNCKNKNGINLYPSKTDFCSYGEKRSDT